MEQNQRCIRCKSLLYACNIVLNVDVSGLFYIHQSGYRLFACATHFSHCKLIPLISLYCFWQGVPVRIEIGPRDVTNKSVVVSRRDVPGKQGKEFGVSMEPSILVNHIKGRLDDIQASLLQKAITFRDR